MGITCGHSISDKKGAKVKGLVDIILSEKQILRSKKDVQDQNKNTIHESKLEFSSLWSSGLSKDDINKVYNIGRIIGEGFTSTVRLATLVNSEDDRRYAVKSLYKAKKNTENEVHFRREVEVIKKADCPFIAQFYECYEDDKYFHLVTEYCNGGDLVTFVQKKGGIEEELAKKFFWQAATAVNYLHFFGVVHRDLKLENFLLVKDHEDNTDIKLIDFGFATNFRDKDLLSPVGTAYYVAPEILDKSYSYKCDVWSLGVVLYMMVTGEAPFRGMTNMIIFDNIKNKEVDLETKKCKGLSKELKELLRSLLVKNPDKRISISSALQSIWFKSCFSHFTLKWSPFLTKKIIESLRDLPTYSVFQREIVKLAVKVHFHKDDIQIRVKIFSLMDFLNNGVVTFQELLKVLSNFGINLSRAQCEAIISKMFLRAENVMTQSEFIAATIDRSCFSQDSFLKPVFNRIDVDCSGLITFDDMKYCFQRFGYVLDDDTIDGFIQEFDIEKKDGISFENFLEAMKKQPHVNSRLS